MDNKTEQMLAALKEYFDQTEISYQGWENESSICKLAYEEFVELSARLSPEIAGNRIAQMIAGFTKLVAVLKKNREKQFSWVADQTPYAIHQDNALISTSKGLAEWGKYLKEVK